MSLVCHRHTFAVLVLPALVLIFAACSSTLGHSSSWPPPERRRPNVEDVSAVLPGTTRHHTEAHGDPCFHRDNDDEKEEEKKKDLFYSLEPRTKLEFPNRLTYSTQSTEGDKLDSSSSRSQVDLVLLGTGYGRRRLFAIIPLNVYAVGMYVEADYALNVLSAVQLGSTGRGLRGRETNEKAHDPSLLLSTHCRGQRPDDASGQEIRLETSLNARELSARDDLSLKEQRVAEEASRLPARRDGSPYEGQQQEAFLCHFLHSHGYLKVFRFIFVRPLKLKHFLGSLSAALRRVRISNEELRRLKKAFVDPFPLTLWPQTELAIAIDRNGRQLEVHYKEPAEEETAAVVGRRPKVVEKGLTTTWLWWRKSKGREKVKVERRRRRRGGGRGGRGGRFWPGVWSVRAVMSETLTIGLLDVLLDKNSLIAVGLRQSTIETSKRLILSQREIVMRPHQPEDAEGVVVRSPESRQEQEEHFRYNCDTMQRDKRQDTSLLRRSTSPTIAETETTTHRDDSREELHMRYSVPLNPHPTELLHSDTESKDEVEVNHDAKSEPDGREPESFSGKDSGLRRQSSSLGDRDGSAVTFKNDEEEESGRGGGSHERGTRDAKEGRRKDKTYQYLEEEDSSSSSSTAAAASDDDEYHAETRICADDDDDDDHDDASRHAPVSDGSFLEEETANYDDQQRRNVFRNGEDDDPATISGEIISISNTQHPRNADSAQKETEENTAPLKGDKKSRRENQTNSLFAETNRSTSAILETNDEESSTGLRRQRPPRKFRSNSAHPLQPPEDRPPLPSSGAKANKKEAGEGEGEGERDEETPLEKPTTTNGSDQKPQKPSEEGKTRRKHQSPPPPPPSSSTVSPSPSPSPSSSYFSPRRKWMSWWNGKDTKGSPKGSSSSSVSSSSPNNDDQTASNIQRRQGREKSSSSSDTKRETQKESVKTGRDEMRPLGYRREMSYWFKGLRSLNRLHWALISGLTLIAVAVSATAMRSIYLRRC